MSIRRAYSTLRIGSRSATLRQIPISRRARSMYRVLRCTPADWTRLTRNCRRSSPHSDSNTTPPPPPVTPQHQQHQLHHHQLHYPNPNPISVPIPSTPSLSLICKHMTNTIFYHLFSDYDCPPNPHSGKSVDEHFS